MSLFDILSLRWVEQKDYLHSFRSKRPSESGTLNILLDIQKGGYQWDKTTNCDEDIYSRGIYVDKDRLNMGARSDSSKYDNNLYIYCLPCNSFMSFVSIKMTKCALFNSSSFQRVYRLYTSESDVCRRQIPRTERIKYLKWT